MSSKSEPRPSKTFHGVPVCLGQAVGKARIIGDAKEFKTFKKGEILIAPFLTPDYASVVHKAKGVVADAGAVMSHAAIVIRELKIPCVVGTKNAASIIKNGDTVRIDAKRGIVEAV